MNCIKVIGWKTKNKYQLPSREKNSTSYLFSLGYKTVKKIICGNSAIELYQGISGDFAVHSSLWFDRKREYIHLSIPTEQDAKKLIDYVVRKLGF